MDSLLEHTQDREVAVLALSGDLDDLQVESLEQRIFEKALVSGGRVVVDLADVRHVQSPALGVMLKMSRALGKLGGGLALANADANLTRLCHVTGLDLGLNLFHDLPSAITFLETRRGAHPTGTPSLGSF